VHRAQKASLIKSRLPVPHNSELIQNQVCRDAASSIQTINALLAIKDQRKGKILLGPETLKQFNGKTTVKTDRDSTRERQALKNIFYRRSLRRCATPASTICPKESQQHNFASQPTQIHDLVDDTPYRE
jgi:hypothetical protein